MIHTFMRFPLPPAKNTTLTEPSGTRPSSYAKNATACEHGTVFLSAVLLTYRGPRENLANLQLIMQSIAFPQLAS